MMLSSSVYVSESIISVCVKGNWTRYFLKQLQQIIYGTPNQHSSLHLPVLALLQNV